MKLSRGQKRCNKCQTVNAARQRVCVYCRQEFVMKNVPLKHEIKDWKALEKGDAFRVINGTGPYYILKGDSHEGKEGENNRQHLHDLRLSGIHHGALGCKALLVIHSDAHQQRCDPQSIGLGERSLIQKTKGA